MNSRFSIPPLVATAMMGLVIASASAQQSDWPSKPIRFVVPAAPGGGTDNIARIWADCVSPKLGQPVVVDNRAGANGITGVLHVKQSPADGYTLFLAGMSHMAITPYVYAKSPFDPQRDFEGISLLVTTPYVLAAGPKSKVTTFEDIAKLSKSNPGSLNIGSPGNGTPAHLMQAIIAERLKIQLTHVPFQGEAAGLNSLAGDQIDLMPFVASTAMPQIAGGKIRPIAVLGPKRLNEIPSTPTITEIMGAPELSHGAWAAVVAKSGTPTAIIEKVHAVTQTCLSDANVVKRFTTAKQSVILAPSDQVKAYTLRDTALWKPIVEKVGIKND